MFVRFEQVRPDGSTRGLCQGADLSVLAPTMKDLLFLHEWVREVEPPHPPELPPDVFYVFLSPEAANRFRDWVGLKSAMALLPVRRVEIDPATVTVVWSDGWQAAVRPRP